MLCYDLKRIKPSVCVKTSEIIMEDKAHSEGLRRYSRWRTEDRYETVNAMIQGTLDIALQSEKAGKTSTSIISETFK